MPTPQETAARLIHKIDLVSIMRMGRRKRSDDTHYARFNRRMMAGTIDSVLLLFLTPVFNAIAPIHQEALNTLQVNPKDPEIGRHIISQILGNSEFINSWLLNFGLQILTFCIYSGICWHYWSATPGKMIMRIKVVDAASEQPISTRQIILRLLGYWVSTFSMVGFFWISFDKKRRAWHDLMAGTTVVALPWGKKKKPASANPPPEPPQETITHETIAD